MEIFVYLFIALAVWFTVAHFMGKPDFWKATRKNPELAWRFFNNHPAWYINEKPENVDIVGPFRVVNPNNGELTKLWCDADKIEKSQEDFMASLQKI